jgi:hypothetical protein
MAALQQLRSVLLTGDFKRADQMTTTMLLEAVGRLNLGWMQQSNGRDLPAALLDGLASAWSDSTQGWYGFRTQQGLYRLEDERQFFQLAGHYGWRGKQEDIPEWKVPPIPRYGEFVAAWGDHKGFFPTLRNPDDESFPAWPDWWRKTVVVTHLRLSSLWEER